MHRHIHAACRAVALVIAIDVERVAHAEAKRDTSPGAFVRFTALGYRFGLLKCTKGASAQTIGYLYLHAGDTRRAISFLKKAHELAPAAADASVLVNLGNLLKYAAHACRRCGRGKR